MQATQLYNQLLMYVPPGQRMALSEEVLPLLGAGPGSDGVAPSPPSVLSLDDAISALTRALDWDTLRRPAVSGMQPVQHTSICCAQGDTVSCGSMVTSCGVKVTGRGTPSPEFCQTTLCCRGGARHMKYVAVCSLMSSAQGALFRSWLCNRKRALPGQSWPSLNGPTALPSTSDHGCAITRRSVGACFDSFLHLASYS
jgi:hypothetical protein